MQRMPKLRAMAKTSNRQVFALYYRIQLSLAKQVQRPVLPLGAFDHNQHPAPVNSGELTQALYSVRAKPVFTLVVF